MEIKDNIIANNDSIELVDFVITETGIQDLTKKSNIISNTFNLTNCNTVNCTTVQCTTIDCTTVQCTTIDCTTIDCTEVQCRKSCVCGRW